MMGIFDKFTGGSGMMNQIRCDLSDYLVWHWEPEASGGLQRSSAIRFGSSLRVKDGEAAVFVYRQSNGIAQEVIYGPYDGIIETKNFPILADIISKFYGGGTPFQADVYFINLAGVVQMSFGIPYTNTADPRFPDFVVPVSAGGVMTFRIANVEQFIRKHRMIGFSIQDLQQQVRQIVERYGKSAVANAPYRYNIPLNQIERALEFISTDIEQKIKPEMADFGVEMVRWDLNRVEPDKESEGWRQLMQITRGRQASVLNTQTEMEVQNLRDMQAINSQNMAESLRIQREELQRAQRLQTESSYFSAHALNRQAEVLQTAAENLGSMTAAGEGGNGMNMAGMMAGMYMGGAVGNQFGQMMQQMNPAMNGAGGSMPGGMTPPPFPGQQPPLQCWVLINNQQAGPFDFSQLQQLVANGNLSPGTYVWMPGMAQWLQAANVPQIAAVFTPGANSVPPAPPSVP